MNYYFAKDLRESFLQSAFKGELTSKKDGDSNAYEYVKKIINIQNEKAERKEIKIGKFNKNIINDFGFEFPKHWALTKIGYISSLVTKQTGFDYSKRIKPNLIEEKQNNCYPLIQTRNFKGENFDFSSKYYLPIDIANEYPNLILDKDCLLFSIVGASIGNVGLFINRKEIGFIGGAISKVDLISNDYIKYLFYYLQSPLGRYQIMKNYKSTAQGTITVEDVRNIVVPFPPIEEQQRIVTIIDDLMVKIDEYEKLEEQLLELKKVFPSDMKDSILQAAMQGKLTEQLSSDSSANELAKKIKAERSSLGHNKHITNSSNERCLPNSWAWIKSGECFCLMKGEKVTNVSLPYLEAKYLRGKSSPVIMNSGEFVKKGTTVILVDGENSGEIFVEPEDGIIGSTFKVLYIPECINKKYALYFLEMNKMLFKNNKKGAAIPHLNNAVFNDLVMPIPPIEEQQRIVDLLDKVLPLCDQLEEVI